MQLNASAYVWLLALVPLLLALYGYAFWQKRHALAAFVAAGLAVRLLPNLDPRRRWLKALCLVGAVAGLVVALMQPQWGEGTEQVPRRGRDLIVVLDVSLSMLAEDVAPNRLEGAKQAIAGLARVIQDRGGHRLGLVTFAGRASLQVPLTRDYGLFLERLNEVGVASAVRTGTLIGDALRQTLRGFGELAPGFTDVILITDGDDHDSLPVEAAREAAGQGVGLYVVGVGDAGVGAPIPLAQVTGEPGTLSYQGEEVRSRLRSELLAELAGAADGVYLPAGAGDLDLEDLYAQHIAGLPRRDLEATTSEGRAHRYQWFVLVALVLLGLEMMMRDQAGRSG